MLATPHHASNRTPAVDPSLFRNDANNVAALQTVRLQKKLLEEAARLQQEQLNEAAGNLKIQIEDKEKIQQERDELRRSKESLSQTVELMNTELEASRNKIERLTAANQETQNQRDNLKKQKQIELKTLEKQKEDELVTLKKQKDDELETLKEQKQSDLSAWESERGGLKGQLSSVLSSNAERVTEIDRLNKIISVLAKSAPNSRQDNCLPFQYHNSTVMIINIRSQMALDFGKDGGTKAYAWEFIWENPYQIFKLSNTSDNPDPDRPWVISRKDDDRRLYFPSADLDVDVHVGTSIPGKQDYWYIGRGSSDQVGSWV
ncbi:MAG: hypothetical protein M1829_001352 [Trizodia sp. TS-e1964]|nr:MAG: hypothetical protein M1829_001352 [Trizodia sp. TS-e1964]